MSTPKGMKCVLQTLATGDKVLIYSDTDQIERAEILKESKLIVRYLVRRTFSSIISTSCSKAVHNVNDETGAQCRRTGYHGATLASRVASLSPLTPE